MCNRLLIVGLLALAPQTCLAAASWVRITCENEYEFTHDNPMVACEQWSLLEDGDGYFIPIFARAKADRTNGLISVSSGGGAIEGIGDDSGAASAYLRESYLLRGEWSEWATVKTKVLLSYRFTGFGASFLRVNLRSYAATGFTDNGRAGFEFHYNGHEQVRLVETMNEGLVELPEEADYPNTGTMVVTVTHKVHYSKPEFGIRLDVLASSLPNIGLFGSRVSSVVEANAQITFALEDKDVEIRRLLPEQVSLLLPQNKE